MNNDIEEQRIMNTIEEMRFPKPLVRSYIEKVHYEDKHLDPEFQRRHLADLEEVRMNQEILNEAILHSDLPDIIKQFSKKQYDYMRAAFGTG